MRESVSLRRRLRVSAVCLLGGFLVAHGASAWAATEIAPLISPDERIRVSFSLPDPGSQEMPRWSATFRGRPVLSDCELGLETVAGGSLLAGGRLVQEQRRTMNRRIPMLFGKADHAENRYHEAGFVFEPPGQPRVTVIFRCYNDAIALRYELRGDDTTRSVTIVDESTSFRVEGDPTAYIQVLEHHLTSHEHNVQTVRYADLPKGSLLDLPLSLAWSDGTFAAITEAALRRYAGMALQRPVDDAGTPRLVGQLSPRPDGTKVVGALPLKTPWRVVLLGDRPGALLESTTIYALNDPSAVADTSWIQPGKITFSWWNGDVYDGEPGEPILSEAMARKYIDWCVRQGIPTHAIGWTDPPTSPWYFQSSTGTAPGPDTDVTRPRDDFDLPAIRRYADSKGIRLWTWVHQAALRGRVEEAFATFEAQGWSGMMVDFFDHDDQATVEFAEEILEAAARHHILIQLHGVWKPTGLERTFPNLVNHEGALNLEYLKWNDRCSPEHDLMMAFTRLIAGPMDYHLGGFRSIRREAFEPRVIAPRVMGTRSRMLAMYVCFDNSNPMVADYPTAYDGQPGFDFLQRVPTWWDETRVLVGEVGRVLVTARRKGDTWYLGGLSAGASHEQRIPLHFLGGGDYTATIWKDPDPAVTDPNELLRETLPVSHEATLQLRFARDGGFVAELKPAAP